MAQPALYKQKRGSNGQFATGLEQNSVKGKYSHLNPLFYYIYENTYETRRVEGQNGKVYEPGRRKAKSKGETAVNNRIQTAGLQSARVQANLQKKVGLR